ncbi:hypothetical protein ACP63_27310, partial [Escherichia coli]
PARASCVPCRYWIFAICYGGKLAPLQGTHDARAGDIRDVAQPCAEVLVRLGKAEYITARRPAGQKKKRDAEHGECGTFCGEPEKTRNQDVT